ncbi:cold shock domain-containing protein [Rubrivivax sp. RP6-9]|uniref:cold shock domain-containing protein n=1 Tax=Rubrivivax sp. RP6-9 TaxID=3415750 RepID=UPI003CC58085
MPITGTLRSWNEDRGFGFIAPTHGGAEIFVHASAFARDGSSPTVGENLSYELGRGRDGKPQAVNVVRLAVGSRPPRAPSGRETHKSQTSWVGLLIIALLLGTGGVWGYKQFSGWQHRKNLASQPAELSTPAPGSSEASPAAFSCDGRVYCSQMTSCAEAKWFINNCPGTKMDGNSDGIPCQEQWCN